ncbi:sodium:proton antiporter [Ectothiorhodospira haloalkaliphila]|uniref:Sodium:proton antiporter n=1 Tax=Ectothiorhodospira haloalkaliphila TaxID=421628 RepID=W8L7Q2_9GAMM|nr:MULTISPECIES: monovalent cation/H(+) antiporter subunit G [Ectothiorhodospira]AHK79875.1 sodium:proton antiporter [Ectothiorhodospira haloalkaliphila]MCG5493304.1 monovalent cation/H(+) antiporter subunit G [Ectothiorhodospira variabilis]MCG5496648.1 monovalent cation/H(+) antiporter subunit G [Ectothiorhodospira variabilis]MCG5502633.1 monovalent cation/H(+) antiporter subunit G [Ectothiorhodospira variabilis]MCG5505601.1 monovalent cation/H(+) antiporter subunit G [Ectothiorhodospira vari
MTDVVVSLFLLIGAGFMFVAALGLLRMPDLPMRLHATTKAGALGGGLMVIAVGLEFFGDVAVAARAAAIIIFIVLTAPIAAHLIGRAGYFVGLPMWSKTLKDELKDRYDPQNQVLLSPGEVSSEDKPDRDKAE